MKSLMRIGIVVQRYGKDITGGSETLARDVAEHLNASGCDVTVFTSCARDYISWKNEFAPGESILKGVRILRFPVEHERDIEEFNCFSESLFPKLPNTSPEEEKKWLEMQGPFCPSLIDKLHTSQSDFDCFIFFTYLYYTAVEGIKTIKKPIILFPTAHDEPPLYLNMIKNVFHKPDALFFLTRAEQEFVLKTFSPQHSNVLIRTGIEIDDSIDENQFKRNYFQIIPYLLYAGRIEKGKGLEVVFEAFGEMRKRRLINLVLIGKKLMDIPDIEGINYLGYIPEKDKLAAFKGAIASIQPSALESLSITTLESFSVKTPVLVNKKSPALVEHVELSEGGFSYEDPNDLIRKFFTLYDNRNIRNQIGIKGYNYVKTYFSWDVVLENIKKHLNELVFSQGAFLQNRPLDPRKTLHNYEKM